MRKSLADRIAKQDKTVARNIEVFLFTPGELEQAKAKLEQLLRDGRQVAAYTTASNVIEIASPRPMEDQPEPPKVAA